MHCFTDSPGFAQRLLDYFPNLYIGITGILLLIARTRTITDALCPKGVITYSSNQNTSAVIRNLARTPPLRILLETDAPYMVPGNIYKSLTSLKSGARLPLCHTAMLPWTAAFVADVANGIGDKGECNESSGPDEDVSTSAVSSAEKLNGYDVERVMREARENARSMYGV